MRLKNMSAIRHWRIYENITMFSTTLCSFWKNLSGHFERFDCNHSNGYAHVFIFMGRIAQTDSLSDVVKKKDPKFCIPIKCPSLCGTV